MSVVRVNRRTFLKVSGTAAGGLLVGYYVRERGRKPSTFAPNGFVRVNADSTVTIWAKNPDMGQGTKTSLPMMIADELDVDWSSVRVEQGNLDTRAFGGQGSGGSDATPSDGPLGQRAGALARAMLIAAAADTWRVAPGACETAHGIVRHGESNRTLTYAELAPVAAALPPPSKTPPLKSRDRHAIIGTRVRGVDVPRIVVGAPIYGLDVRVPGMLHAVIEKCPVHGGRPSKVDAAGALAVPGVRRVVMIEGHTNPTYLRPGVAVVADSTWAAMKGREALRVTWDEGSGGAESSDALSARFHELLASTGTVVRNMGDVERAFAAARAKVDVIYEAPFLAHATLEPQNCVAHVKDDRCEIWGPLQMPTSGARVVADAIGIPRANVAVNVTRAGGGFGRRLLSDFAAEAAYISKAVAAPVQVVWSREDDMRHDYYRPASMHRVRAGLDAEGRISVWDHHVASVSRNAYRGDPEPAFATEIYGLLAPRTADAKIDFSADLTPTLIPNCRLAYSDVASVIPRGALRAPAHNFNAFVIQSVMDELAHASGRDSIALRRVSLGRGGDYPSTGTDPAPYNPDRLQHVLSLAVEKSDWGAPLPNGHGRGVAAHFTFGSYCAHVAEVSVDMERHLRVHRVVSAIDVGVPVNPLNLEAQTQGGIIDGLSASLFGEITIAEGRTVQSAFDDYPLLRHRDTPDIDVHIVPSQEPSTGFGEIALPPVAPAVANAIFAACGVRVRRLPFVKNGFSVQR
ncbi:MAG TPA: molybdopterin cofactor-binding domain-containing protein [Vicinamibacterales bacterium]